MVTRSLSASTGEHPVTSVDRESDWLEESIAAVISADAADHQPGGDGSRAKSRALSMPGRGGERLDELLVFAAEGSGDWLPK
jgi:hypothetical protein